MARILKNNERGATPIYTIGVIILVVLLIGGVMLLKNISGGDINTGESVKTSKPKDDDTKNKTDDSTKNDDKTDNNVTKTDPTTEYTPGQLTATGPEDFVVVIVGLMLAGATIYAAKEYVKSRSMIKSTLLQK